MIIESWVWWTLLAASMQSVRTAGQKHLISDITPLAATLVRYLFGLPFVFLYITALLCQTELSTASARQVTLGQTFFVCATLAGVLQIIATILLIRLFGLKNFAVGSSYIRTEIVITAILGMLFFGEMVDLSGWFAILICVIGLIMVNLVKAGLLHSLWNRSAVYGLASGLCFALTSLFLRKASLSLENSNFQYTAAITLTYMVTMQTAITFIYVYVTSRNQIALILGRWRPSLFVGITSVLGSIGWFTAMTIERATYVKTLGQIEFFITYLVSVFFFRETPSKREMSGMLLILAGVIVLLMTHQEPTAL